MSRQIINEKTFYTIKCLSKKYKTTETHKYNSQILQ